MLQYVKSCSLLVYLQIFSTKKHPVIPYHELYLASPPHADQSAPQPPVGRQNPAIFSKDNERYLKEGLGNSGKTQWKFLDEFFWGRFCGWNLQWGLGMQSILRSFFFDGRSLLQPSSHNSAEDIPDGWWATTSHYLNHLFKLITIMCTILLCQYEKGYWHPCNLHLLTDPSPRAKRSVPM